MSAGVNDPWFILRYRDRPHDQTDMPHDGRDELWRMQGIRTREELFRQVQALVQRGVNPGNIQVYRRTEAQCDVKIALNGIDAVCIDAIVYGPPRPDKRGT